jgi:hypothetical protein
LLSHSIIGLKHYRLLDKAQNSPVDSSFATVLDLLMIVMLHQPHIILVQSKLKISGSSMSKDSPVILSEDNLIAFLLKKDTIPLHRIALNSFSRHAPN